MLCLLLVGNECICCVTDRSGLCLLLELDLLLVPVIELSISEGAGCVCVCVLHWGLDDELRADGAVQVEFASLGGRECLGGLVSEWSSWLVELLLIAGDLVRSLRSHSLDNDLASCLPKPS